MTDCPAPSTLLKFSRSSSKYAEIKPFPHSKTFFFFKRQTFLYLWNLGPPQCWNASCTPAIAYKRIILAMKLYFAVLKILVNSKIWSKPHTQICYFKKILHLKKSAFKSIHNSKLKKKFCIKNFSLEILPQGYLIIAKQKFSLTSQMQLK